MRITTIIPMTLLLGCSNVIVSDYTLEVEPIFPFNQNPFSGTPNSALIISDNQGNAEFYPLGSLTTGTVNLSNMPPLEDAQLGLLLYDDTNTETFRAFGQVGPLDLDLGKEQVQETLFIGQHLQVGTIGELPSPRLGAATAITEDGTTYLFGGADSPNATQASAEILAMSPLDSGDWEFDVVGEITQPNGAAFPLVGAKAVVVNIDGLELIHVIGGTDSLRTLALTPPASFLFDPAVNEIIWHPSTDKEEPYFNKYEPYVATLDNGHILSVSANYQPTQGGWSLPSSDSASAEVFDPVTKEYTHRQADTGQPFGGFSGAEIPFEGHLLCGGGRWLQEGSTGWLVPDTSCRLLKSNLTRESWESLPVPSTGVGIAFHSMVALNNEEGSILLTGGVTQRASNTQSAPATPAAWILRNPSVTATWEPVGDLNTARAAHRMIPTPDGGALVIGGGNAMGPGYPADFSSVSCVEYFNPQSDTFEQLGSCEESGAGPFPVVATHPEHESLLFGNYLLTEGRGEFAVLPTNGPSNLDWALLE